MAWWQHPAAQHEQEILRRPVNLGAGTVRPVSVVGAQPSAVEVSSEILHGFGRESAEHTSEPVFGHHVIVAECHANVLTVDHVVRERTLEAAAWWLPRVCNVVAKRGKQLSLTDFGRIGERSPVRHLVEVSA